MWEDGQCVPAGYIEEYISDYPCTEEADKYVGGGRVPKIRCTLCPEKHKGEYGKMRVWFFKDGTKEEMRQACEEAAAKFTPYWYQAEGTKCSQSFCS